MKHLYHKVYNNTSVTYYILSDGAKHMLWHKEDGPARISPKGTAYYYLNSTEYPEKRYYMKVAK